MGNAGSDPSYAALTADIKKETPHEKNIRMLKKLKSVEKRLADSDSRSELRIKLHRAALQRGVSDPHGFGFTRNDAVEYRALLEKRRKRIAKEYRALLEKRRK